jgi:hypothetical protein
VLLPQDNIQFLFPGTVQIAETADMCCNTCQPLN